jgi:hypothetical protein
MGGLNPPFLSQKKLMRNFKVGRLWGVLGKQQSYSGPTPPTGNKVPLNNNPMNSWDYKKSNYRRLDGRANAIQQGGAVPQDNVTPTPTGTSNPTPTPTSTPNPTPTTTPTPTLVPFNPSSISGLTTWFVPTLGITTSGGYVTSWTDQIGSRVAIPTSLTDFTLTDTLNGINGITAPSSNVDSMSWSSIDTYTDLTVFGVVKRDSTGTNNPQYFMGNDTAQGIGVAYDGGTGYKPYIFDGSTGMLLQGGTDITTPQYLTWALGTSTGFINQNGVQVASNSGNANPQVINRIFENTTAGFRALQGTIWEVLIYDRVLTSTEITQVETYLSSKYSL